MFRWEKQMEQIVSRYMEVSCCPQWMQVLWLCWERIYD